jgi:hypothetical protein
MPMACNIAVALQHRHFSHFFKQTLHGLTSPTSQREGASDNVYEATILNPCVFPLKSRYSLLDTILSHHLIIPYCLVTQTRKVY